MSDAGYVRRSRRTTYENPWLRFEAHDIVHPNGRAGEHGVVITPRSCAAFVLDGDEVILARQARYAIDRVVLEIVKGGAAAGRNAAGCGAARTARRAGHRSAARWERPRGSPTKFPRSWPNPIALFLARDITAVASEPEDVETIVMRRQMPFRAATARRGAAAKSRTP